MGSLLIIRTIQGLTVCEGKLSPTKPTFSRLPAPCPSFASTPLRALPRQTSKGWYIKQRSDTHLYYTVVLHLTFPHFFQQSQLKTQKIASFKIDLLFGRAHIQVPAKSFRECAAEGCCFNLFCACDIIARNLYHASLLGMASVPIWIFLPLIHPNKLERVFYKKHPSST